MAYDPRLGDRFLLDADDLAAGARGALSAGQARVLDATAGITARLFLMRRGRRYRRTMERA